MKSVISKPLLTNSWKRLELEQLNISVKNCTITFQFSIKYWQTFKIPYPDSLQDQQLHFQINENMKMYNNNLCIVCKTIFKNAKRRAEQQCWYAKQNEIVLWSQVTFKGCTFVAMKMKRKNRLHTLH